MSSYITKFDSSPTTSHNWPEKRWGHTLSDSHIGPILYGGFFNNRYFNDSWLFTDSKHSINYKLLSEEQNINSTSSTSTSYNNKNSTNLSLSLLYPNNRSNHTTLSFYYNNISAILINGGATKKERYNDGYLLIPYEKKHPGNSTLTSSTSLSISSSIYGLQTYRLQWYKNPWITSTPSSSSIPVYSQLITKRTLHGSIKLSSSVSSNINNNYNGIFLLFGGYEGDITNNQDNNTLYIASFPHGLPNLNTELINTVPSITNTASYNNQLLSTNTDNLIWFGIHNTNNTNLSKTNNTSNQSGIIQEVSTLPVFCDYYTTPVTNNNTIWPNSRRLFAMTSNEYTPNSNNNNLTTIPENTYSTLIKGILHGGCYNNEQYVSLNDLWLVIEVPSIIQNYLHKYCFQTILHTNSNHHNNNIQSLLQDTISSLPSWLPAEEYLSLLPYQLIQPSATSSVDNTINNDKIYHSQWLWYSWKQPNEITGHIPSSRWGHTITHIPNTYTYILIGGFTSTGDSSEIYILQLSYMETNQEYQQRINTYIQGDNLSLNNFNLSSRKWLPVIHGVWTSPQILAPSLPLPITPRRRHTTVYVTSSFLRTTATKSNSNDTDNYDDGLLIFGGFSGNSYHNDTYTININKLFETCQLSRSSISFTDSSLTTTINDTYDNTNNSLTNNNIRLQWPSENINNDNISNIEIPSNNTVTNVGNTTTISNIGTMTNQPSYNNQSNSNTPIPTSTNIDGIWDLLPTVSTTLTISNNSSMNNNTVLPSSLSNNNPSSNSTFNVFDDLFASTSTATVPTTTNTSTVSNSSSSFATNPLPDTNTTTSSTTSIDDFPVDFPASISSSSHDFPDIIPSSSSSTINFSSPPTHSRSRTTSSATSSSLSNSNNNNNSTRPRRSTSNNAQNSPSYPHPEIQLPPIAIQLIEQEVITLGFPKEYALLAITALIHSSFGNSIQTVATENMNVLEPRDTSYSTLISSPLVKEFFPDDKRIPTMKLEVINYILSNEDILIHLMKEQKERERSLSTSSPNITSQSSTNSVSRNNNSASHPHQQHRSVSSSNIQNQGIKSHQNKNKRTVSSNSATPVINISPSLHHHSQTLSMNSTPLSTDPWIDFNTSSTTNNTNNDGFHNLTVSNTSSPQFSFDDNQVMVPTGNSSSSSTSFSIPPSSTSLSDTNNPFADSDWINNSLSLTNKNDFHLSNSMASSDTFSSNSSTLFSPLSPRSSSTFPSPPSTTTTTTTNRSNLTLGQQENLNKLQREVVQLRSQVKSFSIMNQEIATLRQKRFQLEKEIKDKDVTLKENEKKIYRLKDEIENMNRCLICYDHSKNTVFLPCRHFVACHPCLVSITGVAEEKYRTQQILAQADREINTIRNQLPNNTTNSNNNPNIPPYFPNPNNTNNINTIGTTSSSSSSSLIPDISSNSIPNSIPNSTVSSSIIPTTTNINARPLCPVCRLPIEAYIQVFTNTGDDV